MKQKVLFLLVLMYTLIIPMGTVFCEDLDSLNQDSSTRNQVSESGGSSGTEDESFNSISDYMRGYNAVTDEDMESASKMVGPVTALIGKAIGVILLLVNSLVFLVTALDILYIAVPFTRKFLNPSNLQQGGGMMPGMGMGMRMGMSMGGGAAGGGADPNAHKWVSDEAVAALIQGGQMQGAGGGGAMGMSMGGYGSMGAMGGQQAQPQGTKSIIGIYLKKRMFFLVVFAIATTILMSSILLDCGLNLAQLLHRILNMFNDGISNVDI